MGNTVHNYSFVTGLATNSDGKTNLALRLGWLAPLLQVFNHLRAPMSAARQNMLKRLLLLILLVSVSKFLWAQQISDTAITCEYVPGMPTPLGQVVEVRLRLSNNSDLPVSGGVFLDESYIDPNISVRDEFIATSAFSCPQEPSCSSCYIVGTIAPRSSGFCSSSLRATTRGLAPARFRALTFTYGNITDPNPSNNSVICELSISGGTTLQAPISLASYLMMAGLVLGIGVWAARRSG
jgi:hypothetical protein